MNKTKVFIDGREGTTGLRINERFAHRDDIELLSIDPEKRKDPTQRSRLMADSDITILCLPDAAAMESVALWKECGNDAVRLIDTSTAHRTAPGWAYGFPEFSPAFREQIQNGKCIAVPGCFPTGFIALCQPLIAAGILGQDYPISCFAITGYSGGGKVRIAEYEATDRPAYVAAPREYGLSQQHKHLTEMQKIPGFTRAPHFSPIIADFHSGMLLTVPLFADLLTKKVNVSDIHSILAEYYQAKPFVSVMPLGSQQEEAEMLRASACAGFDDIELFVLGNNERIQLVARYDNLGKGASGAAIQCLNLMIGCPESTGLRLRHS
jgi:N-acetyl-gamma-glutamyl-phosphate reductase